MQSNDRNREHNGFGHAFERDENRRFQDQRYAQGGQRDWDGPSHEPRDRYEGGYGYPTQSSGYGAGSESGGYPYSEGGLYGQRESTPYPRGGYNDSGANDYGSRQQDRYREQQYGRAGRHESEYTTSGRREAQWPQGSSYSRGEYDRAQSDWGDRQYGAGTMGLSGYGDGPSGMGYGQGPIGTQPHYGNRNPERKGPKGYNRSDERIREDVCDCFMRSQHFNPGEVEVEVKNGEVTLKGEVDDREEKFSAERAAESVLGVRDVHNQLRCPGRRGSTDSSSSTSESGSSQRGGGGSRQQPQRSGSTGAAVTTG